MWLWKEWHKDVVPAEVPQQSPPKHHLDDDHDVDAPKNKKARRGRKAKQAKKKMAQDGACMKSSDGLADGLDIGEGHGETEDAHGSEPDSASVGTIPSRSLSQPHCDEEKAPSHAEVLDDNDSLKPRFEQAYTLVAEILDEEYNEKANIGLAQMEVVQSQQEAQLKALQSQQETQLKILQSKEEANAKKAEKKMDQFWKLADTFL